MTLEVRHVGVRGDCVAEVVAGVALPVIGPVSPGDGFAAGEDVRRLPGAAEARGLGGGGDPADRVALGGAIGDWAAVPVEAGGVLKAEAEQEAGDALGFRPVAGGGEGD